MGTKPNKNEVTILPDGSAFGVISIPLPEDHWLYAPQCKKWDNERDCPADLPKPIVGNTLRDHVKIAARWAVRGATMNGTEPNFDPDALVLNFAYALCGAVGTRGMSELQAAQSETDVPSAVLKLRSELDNVTKERNNFWKFYTDTRSELQAAREELETYKAHHKTCLELAEECHQEVSVERRVNSALREQLQAAQAENESKYKAWLSVNHSQAIRIIELGDQLAASQRDVPDAQRKIQVVHDEALKFAERTGETIGNLEQQLQAALQKIALLDENILSHRTAREFAEVALVKSEAKLQAARDDKRSLRNQLEQLRKNS